VTVVDGTADAIPVPDGSVDEGVVSLVLCSVPDHARTLAEPHRVIRPGGQMRFDEDVAPGDPVRARWQRRLTPVWSVLAGGCHLHRRTDLAIAAAGFDLQECDRFLYQPCLAARPTAPHVLGTARRLP
jgi:hypothetical protein